MNPHSGQKFTKDFNLIFLNDPGRVCRSNGRREFPAFDFTVTGKSREGGSVTSNKELVAQKVI